MRDAKASLAFFLAAFGAYLYAIPPYLAPYRDAGEMATAAATLGVCHPPSYPLYVLLGKLSQALPFGSPAYRLTLLSALCAAGAVAALFLFLRARVGLWPAAFAALWLGANDTLVSIAIVPEMYALGLLQAAALLGLALRLRDGYDPRLWRGFAFLYGLSLGNRTDLLLLAPGLFFLAFSSLGWRRQERSGAAWLLATALWGAAGLSVYLYLPLRSSAGPWLDWNHPASLSNFVGSLTRRSYGGTLDLLSRHYATGAMFLENLKVYGRHLWGGYLGWLCWLPPLGLWAAWSRDRATAIGLGLAYAAAGPVFLFLANLPPNPHAMAIVEPHYLLSDLILAALAAMGASWAWERLPVRGPSLAAAGLALGLLPLWRDRHPSLRWNLASYDYVRNVLLSVPKDGTLVAKKDVQLFSLWYAQRVEGLRPDVRLVAQGLAGSSWYQEASRRAGEPARLGPLRDAADWRRLAEWNGQTFATPDADLPSDLKVGPGRGLVIALSSAAAGSADAWSFVARRGDFRYERQPNFFHSDLIESHAAARQRLGAWLSERGRHEESLPHLQSAWAMKWLFVEAPVFLGFASFQRGRLEEAKSYYEAAVSIFERTLGLAAAYHSLPDVWTSAHRGLADVSLNLGVIFERLGRREEAERSYRRTLEHDPKSAQAHFNLGVLYWNRDWRRAAEAMAQAVRLDPGREDAARYLAVARQRLAAPDP
ncbi:MAG: DUF2723 domain-containing protein [Elusimicrobia bacterium]|nr:DUF2723 domain-containing protein [Elusimicrobiota bacterium]